MSRRVFFILAILAAIQFSLGILLSPPSLAQEWAVGGARGTLKVVDLGAPSVSAAVNYAEGLVTLDKDNNLVACLAEDWRWIDDRTIEFRLRKGVTFHNGERVNAESVRVNWEEYKRMESPRPYQFLVPPDETIFEIIDEYTMRFTFPKPQGLAVLKFWYFGQFAPAFFMQHTFEEYSWNFLPEPGPWGAGPFILIEGHLGHWVRPSDRIVLEAYKGYWDRRYPKVERVIFDYKLASNRKEAMRLCRETEGKIDITSHIRPLDTLKVTKSPFAKVVKSRDIGWLRGIFNLRKKESKWRDIRLRKALNYSINRKELWKYGAKGNAYNLAGFIPPGACGHNPDLNLYTYDTTKARALLAEAGYPEGFEVKIIALERLELEMKIIKRMLVRVGLRVNYEILTEPEFWRKIVISILDKPPEEQEWDIHFFTVSAYFGHPAAMLPWNFIEETGLRWIEYDPVYENMWKDMKNITDSEAQEEKIRQMVQYLYEQAYALFIYTPITLYAVNKEVNFVPHKSATLNLRETSVTDNHWSVRAEKNSFRRIEPQEEHVEYLVVEIVL